MSNKSNNTAKKKKKKKIPQGKSTKIVLNNEWTNNDSDKYMCIYTHTY